MKNIQITSSGGIFWFTLCILHCKNSDDVLLSVMRDQSDDSDNDYSVTSTTTVISQESATEPSIHSRGLGLHTPHT